MIAGVTPGKGGTSFEGIPIFDTVSRAVAETAANASVIYVPPPFAADAMMEAVDAAGFQYKNGAAFRSLSVSPRGCRCAT